jgi:hypothetical protein
MSAEFAALVTYELLPQPFVVILDIVFLLVQIFPIAIASFAELNVTHGTCCQRKK